MTPDIWEIQGWAVADLAACDAHVATRGMSEVASSTQETQGGWVHPSADHRVALVLVEPGQPTEVTFGVGTSGGGRPSDCVLATEWHAVMPGQAILLDARYWMRFRCAGIPRFRSFSMPIIEQSHSSDDLADWRQKGFSFFRGGLETDRVSALGEAMDRAMEIDVALFGETALKAKGHYGALRNLPDLDPVFIDLLDDNPVFALIDQILPRAYILRAYDGLILAPGEGRYPWDFHTDLEALNGLWLAGDQVLAVNVLYYLDDTTPENGATYIVPNSHLSRLAAPRQALLEECAIPATGQPGDILVFDSRLWHCAGNNATMASRRLIKTLFCAPWIRPAMNYRHALSNGKWDALSDRVRTLLGGDVSVPASVAEFRGMVAKCAP